MCNLQLKRKRRKEYHTTVLKEQDTAYTYRRTKAGRKNILSRGDSGDGGDSDLGIPPNTETAVTVTPLSEAKSAG